MNLAVVGAGFVGIIQAAVMAKQGNPVHLYDIDEAKIQQLTDFCERRSEKLPVHEQGLPDLLRSGYAAKLLQFSTDSKRAIDDATVIFITVGTPPGADGKANLNALDKAAHQIGKVLQANPKYKLIINKSTVPVGTAEHVEKIIKQYYQGEFDIASNPETLAEGRAVRDALYPKRVIIGTNTEKAQKILFDLYAPFFAVQQEKICSMSRESAELTKYACNAYLASQVVLTNIFANLAKKVGANWRDMVPAIMTDNRIGRFVHPGPGFGGSCFYKDLAQLRHTMEEFQLGEQDQAVLQAVLTQNKAQKKVLHSMVTEVFGNDLSGKTFAVWGLSFKKDTNDVRDAASVDIIPALLAQGASVHAHDPEAEEEFQKEMHILGVDTTQLILHNDKYEAVKGADGLLITNDWQTYRRPDFLHLQKLLKHPHIFDGKDLLPYRQIKEEGLFAYYSIARPNIKK